MADDPRAASARRSLPNRLKQKEPPADRRCHAVKIELSVCQHGSIIRCGRRKSTPDSASSDAADGRDLRGIRGRIRVRLLPAVLDKAFRGEL
jgi:hypothetical protein